LEEDYVGVNGHISSIEEARRDYREGRIKYLEEISDV